MSGGHPSGREPHRGGRACALCTFFGIRPAAPAVDPEGRSSAKADRFCMVHRARSTEGSCVLCGRRLPWAVLEDSSRVGCCRPCYAERYGEGEAQDLEEVWAKRADLEEEE